MMFLLGKSSKSELSGVQPGLVVVVEDAIKITEVDFTVHDGLRTIKEQEEYFSKGVTTTMTSKHLPQKDGYGYAVDLVPYINGKLRWEIDACCAIAEAVRYCAIKHGVAVRWGGSWDVLNNTQKSCRALIDDYVERKRLAGKRAFIDGPHFERVL